MRAGFLVVALFATGLMVGGAMAQSARPKASDWTLDTPKPKAAHKKGPARLEPAVPAEFAERAARNAALQREYFEKQDTAPVGRQKAPLFGGYDAATMSGDGRMGMGFKF